MRLCLHNYRNSYSLRMELSPALNSFVKMAAFEGVFVECKKEFLLQVKRMVRDRNSFKFSAVDAPKRLIVTYPVHRLIFHGALASKFRKSERVGDCLEFYKLGLSSRFVELFGVAATIKANSSLDWSLILPQSYCLDDFDSVEKGDVVFPIKEVEDNCEMWHVFLPGGVEDTDTSKVALESILGITEEELLSHLPDRTVEGFSISVRKGYEHASIRSGSPLVEGDYLVIRGKTYKIHAVSDDDAFTPIEFSRNVVNIKGKFQSNVTSQKLRFKSIPRFHGKIIILPKALLADHKVIECHFSLNKNGNKHGLVHLSYFNTIFNQLGYMIHDRAIHLD